MKSEKFIAIAIAIALPILLLPIVVMAVFFWGNWSANPSSWGDYGDYVAGTTGVLVNVLGFAGVVVTLIWQRAQAQKAENELAKQKVLEHLDRLLGALGDALVGTELRRKSDRQVIAVGRDAFRNLFLLKLRRFYRNKINTAQHNCDQREIVCQAYDELYSRFGSKFGHYFRTLYHCLFVINSDRVSDEDKKELVDS